MNEESFETITGGWYCFTCTAGFKLTAEIRGSRVTLEEREDGGQKTFCAPSGRVFVETEGEYTAFPTEASAANGGGGGERGPKGDQGDKGEKGDAGPAGSMRYARCEKRGAYLYEAWYTQLDYAYAAGELATGVQAAAAGCSSIRAGQFFGRNFDWLYSQVPTVVVHTGVHAGRHATLGVAGAVPGLTGEVLESGELVRAVGLVPYCVTDGLNDAGLAVSTNVVPHNDREDLGDNTVVEPAGECLVELSSLMVPRYVLDNFSTAREAAVWLRDHARVVHPDSLVGQGYEQHYLLADAEETLIVEFVDGGTVVLEADAGCADGTAAPWITNFHRYGSSLDTMHKVVTPDGHGSGGSVPSEESHVSPHAAGLERNNTIADWYSVAVTPVGMASVLDRVKFTRAYQDQGADNWYTDFVGGDLTVDSLPADYAETLAAARAAYQGRDRDEPVTWQTVHAAVYDMEAQTLTLRVQEGSVDYEFTLDAGPRSQPARAVRTVSTATGTSVGYFTHCILSPALFRAGAVTQVSLRARASGNPAGEKYIAVYQKQVDGAGNPDTWKLCGCSVNKCGQTGNKFSTWRFKATEVAGGRPICLRACAQPPSPGETWVVDDAHRLGASAAQRPTGDTDSGMWNGTTHNDYLPEMSIEMLEDAWTAVDALEARVAVLEGKVNSADDATN